MNAQPAIDSAIEQVAPRLRRLRDTKNITLAELSTATGISTSTLSRLESGSRKPSLELLLPVAAALNVSLDEIVAAPHIGDPRIRSVPRRINGRMIAPLTLQQTEPRAYKITIPTTENVPHPRTHPGHEWLYVLSGKLRLVLGTHDLILSQGEAAEFPTETPHWFGSTGKGTTEILSLFGKQGERMHVRAHTREP